MCSHNASGHTQCDWARTMRVGTHNASGHGISCQAVCTPIIGKHTSACEAKQISPPIV